MRLAWLLPLSLLLACGGEPGTTDTTGETTAPPGTTDEPGTTSTGPVDPTSGGSGSAETTAPSTSTSTGPDPGTSSTSTGEPATTTTEGSTTDDTGPAVPGECVADADCKLFEDCCECKGIPADEDPPICKLECDQTKCDAIGVDAAICRLGQCITERLDCDASKVVCLAFPPDCPEGQLPGVDGPCWSGACVPAEICNVVPDCELCPADWMCVSDIPFGPPIVHCEPIPADCMGEPDCTCAGAVCTDQFTFCTDPGGNAINCECIDC